MSEKRFPEVSITVFLFVIFLIILIIKKINELDNFQRSPLILVTSIWSNMNQRTFSINSTQQFMY